MFECTKKYTRFFLWLICFCFAGNLIAQKPMPESNLEIKLENDEKRLSMMLDSKRIDLETNLPIAIYNVNDASFTNVNDPEMIATLYLKKHVEELGLEDPNLANLRHHATRKTNAGAVVRYRQYLGDYPINKAELTVSIDPTNTVQMVLSSYERGVRLESLQAQLSASEALQIAHNYMGTNGESMYEANQLMVYKNKEMTRFAYEVTILSGDPQGEWHVFVDAFDGEIFKAVNMAHYCSDACKHGGHHDHGIKPSSPKTVSLAVRPPMVVATGTGFVFDPDPLSSNMVAYGGGYVDNGDVASAELDAARVSVTLNDIEEVGGVYTLRGPYAEIVDFDAPTTGLFSQNSSTFNFNREDQGFEPVSCYYHIDFLMRYINLTLGCDVMPYQYAGGVQFDPHGANGADNSYYTSGAGRLSFGEGCVDDGEDSDVIHHELGHGLHDWVTAGGLSQVDGLSEGCGDYVAQSYNRSLGYWTPADPQYNWVFNWDGHNECWNGRTTAHTASYPGGLTGSIHTDGQIWATCLMELWDIIGQQEMDKIFYEGLGMTNGSSSQDDAANAVYQAAINLGYTTTQLNQIHAQLTSCGYTLPPLPSGPDDGGISAIVAPTGMICTDSFDPIVTLNNYGSNDITSIDIVYDIDGGTALTFTWTGTLASLGSVDVTLPTMTTTNGAHTFNVSTSTPNGNGDTNTANDAASGGFTTVSGGASVVLNLSTDDYASETSWTLVEDGTGNQIAGENSFTDFTDYNYSWCLPEGCYTFTINDSYGDGICCNFGEGSYSVENGDGTVYGSGGDFASSETVQFCIEPPACVADMIYNNPLASGTYVTSNSITSDATVNSGDNTTFQSNCILLEPNFEVATGAEFLAEIAPCGAVTTTNPALKSNTAKRLIAFDINPMSKIARVQYKLKKIGEHSLQIQDHKGKLVDQLVRQKSTSYTKNELVYDTAKLTSGIYYIILTPTAGEQMVEKIVIE